jgi:EAL domain-containing protein (putative c-di-GMP-specific phosphodiesterase class I)
MTDRRHGRTPPGRDLADELQVALELDELGLVYQPVLDLTSGEVIGVEALCRWTSPTLGPVLPTAFVAAAEDHGLIARLGAWVLRTAVEETTTIIGRVGRPLVLSVNVSPRQIDGRGFARTVLEALDASSLPPGQLELEVTERCELAGGDVVAAGLDPPRSRGVRVAVDDFGTGNSDLARLHHLRAETVKLDRGLVGSLPSNVVAAAMTASMIGVAHDRAARVVAKGVETRAQARWLRAHGCDRAQGLWFSGAVPAGAITGALVRRLDTSD